MKNVPTQIRNATGRNSKSTRNGRTMADFLLGSERFILEIFEQRRNAHLRAGLSAWTTGCVKQHGLLGKLDKIGAQRLELRRISQFVLLPIDRETLQEHL